MSNPPLQNFYIFCIKMNDISIIYASKPSTLNKLLKNGYVWISSYDFDSNPVNRKQFGLEIDDIIPEVQYYRLYHSPIEYDNFIVQSISIDTILKLSGAIGINIPSETVRTTSKYILNIFNDNEESDKLFYKLVNLDFELQKLNNTQEDNTDITKTVIKYMYDLKFIHIKR